MMKLLAQPVKLAKLNNEHEEIIVINYDLNGFHIQINYLECYQLQYCIESLVDVGLIKINAFHQRNGQVIE